MNILNYIILAANCEPCSHLVWAGRANMAIMFENWYLMPHFDSSPLRTGGLLYSLNLYSRRSKLPINQVGLLGLLIPWNSDSSKNRVLQKKWSLFSYHITYYGKPLNSTLTHESNSSHIKSLVLTYSVCKKLSSCTSCSQTLHEWNDAKPSTLRDLLQ